MIGLVLSSLQSGCTALHLAAEAGSVQSVRVLLAALAKIDAENSVAMFCETHNHT